jgi:hypothetical protein
MVDPPHAFSSSCGGKNGPPFLLGGHQDEVELGETTIFSCNPTNHLRASFEELFGWSYFVLFCLAQKCLQIASGAGGGAVLKEV